MTVLWFLLGVLYIVVLITLGVATLRKGLPYQAFVTLALLSAAPLVVVVV